MIIASIFASFFLFVTLLCLSNDSFISAVVMAVLYMIAAGIATTKYTNMKQKINQMWDAIGELQKDVYRVDEGQNKHGE